MPPFFLFFQEPDLSLCDTGPPPRLPHTDSCIIGGFLDKASFTLPIFSALMDQSEFNFALESHQEGRQSFKFKIRDQK